MNANEALIFLQVESTITKDELTKLYRKLVFKYHPDTGGNNEQFIKLQDSYNYLKDMVPFKNSVSPIFGFSSAADFERNVFNQFYTDIRDKFARMQRDQQAQQRWQQAQQQQQQTQQQAQRQKYNTQPTQFVPTWKYSTKGNAWCRFNKDTYIIFSKKDKFKYMIIDDDDKRQYFGDTFNTEDEAKDYIYKKYMQK